MYLEGNLTKGDIEKVMKEHELSGIGMKRGSSLAPSGGEKDHLSVDGHGTARPSNVSMISQYGETDFLNMHRKSVMNFDIFPNTVRRVS